MTKTELPPMTYEQGIAWYERAKSTVPLLPDKAKHGPMLALLEEMKVNFDEVHGRR